MITDMTQATYPSWAYISLITMGVILLITFVFLTIKVLKHNKDMANANRIKRVQKNYKKSPVNTMLALTTVFLGGIFLMMGVSMMHTTQNKPVNHYEVTGKVTTNAIVMYGKNAFPLVTGMNIEGTDNSYMVYANYQGNEADSASRIPVGETATLYCDSTLQDKVYSCTLDKNFDINAGNKNFENNADNLFGRNLDSANK